MTVLGMQPFPTRPPVVYLAGAIRDEHPEDIQWREEIIMELAPYAVFLNPLAGKVYNRETGQWTVAGHLSSAALIVRHDAWCVDRAEIVVANLQALAEGYPNIGTLLELGRAWAQQKLIYAILAPNYQGHQSPGMFGLHPFLQQIVAARFETVAETIWFLTRHLQSLGGENPHCDGEVHAATTTH